VGRWPSLPPFLERRDVITRVFMAAARLNERPAAIRHNRHDAHRQCSRSARSTKTDRTLTQFLSRGALGDVPTSDSVQRLKTDRDHLGCYRRASDRAVCRPGALLDKRHHRGSRKQAVSICGSTATEDDP
jgi:hypothetical protein